MIEMKITADSDLLQQLAYRMAHFWGEGVAPVTQRMLEGAAERARIKWINWAMGGDAIEGITTIRNPSQNLAGSIKNEKTGVFQRDIYSDTNVTHQAQRIQDGTPELDMKTTHPYGPRSRVSKEGIPYLIVPFRWATPNDKNQKRAHFAYFIPNPLFNNSFANMKPTVKTGEIKFEKNYSGQDVPREIKAWGDVSKVPGNMKGMIRAENDAHSGEGGGGYFNFRIISALQLVTKPYSWIRPAVPPLDVVGALAKEMQPIAEEMIRAGLEADFGL
jgi:hypothetical protein